MLPPEHKLAQITPATISEFVSSNFTPGRVVLSGANCDHEHLVSLAEEELGALTGDTVPSMPARYTGGGQKLLGGSGAHVAIGFEGVSWRDDGLVPACVLHTLLGGGGSFSSGGPGKGMYTRLYSEVLNRHAWVTSAVAFNHCYADAGLFGIHASSDDPANMNHLVEVVGSQIGKLTAALAPGELERAKAMTKSSLIMNLESRAIVCEDLGRQVLTNGKYDGPEDLVKKIEAVTEGDVRELAAKMVASTPTVVTYGEEFETQDYTAIASAIQSHAKLAA